MNNRPDISLALDVRSHETVFLLPSQDGVYPDQWVVIDSRHAVPVISSDSVVVIDRVDVQWRTIALITARSPRIIAIIPQGIEHEKSIRRMLLAMFPWAEVWTVSTSIGKALVTAAKGPPYKRDDVIDARPVAEA